MGNKISSKRIRNLNSDQSVNKQKQKVNQLNQANGQNNNNNNSFKSISSQDSQRTNYSCNRPWSRISRRSWKESTLTLPYELSKTAWPVSQSEAYFLPIFPISGREIDSNNQFDILEEISCGAFGQVYKIEDLNTKQTYTLKILSKSKIISENSIEQVKEEVRIQKACGHHPFIVNCTLNWQSKTNLYIVTEYIEGGELLTLLLNLIILPVEIVQLYVAQIALAIDFLHNAGIIYRDLKPENLLLDANANIKLIDFGLSKWLPYGRLTETVCGTPKYMAPEILRAKPYYGHAVDWWSLGVVACLMLTAKFPEIVEMDTPTLYLPEMTDNSLDAASKDLLLRLLNIDPAQRIKSIRKLQTIAFYKSYNFNEVKQQNVSAKPLLIKHFGADYINRKWTNMADDHGGIFDQFDADE